MTTKLLEKLCAAAALVVPLSGTLPAVALTPTEVVKLLASDGSSPDQFGVRVAMDGDTVVIGAYTDEMGTNSGSAYVFVRSGSTWIEEAKLTASDGAAGDYFGGPLDIAADTAVISAAADDDNGENSGSAYVFVRSGSAWFEEAKLTAADGAAGDAFGSWIALDGDTVLIGAARDDDNGAESGSVYVFVRSGTTWAQQAKLTASDGAAGDQFGSEAVALSGDTAVIAAPRDDDNGDQSGSAYVFVRSGTTWTQQAKLTPSDGAATDVFGFGIQIEGDSAIIGAPNNDDNGDQSGCAYVFIRSGAGWFQQAKLIASDAAAGDSFGRKLAMSGDVAVIGAIGDDDNGSDSGSAYVFVRSDSAWIEQAKLTASDGALQDRFGWALAVDGDYLVASAVGDDDQGGQAGSAYVFKLGMTNAAPSANAGPDQVVNEGDAVDLDGSGSNDPDGDEITFQWAQVAGPPVSLDLIDPVHPAFVAPIVQVGGATLTFELRVSDGEIESDPDVVNVTVVNVNQAPVADAGNDQTVQEGSPVELDGSASFDFDGDSLTFSWVQTSGPSVPLSGPATAQPWFSAPLVGAAGATLTFYLTVSDGLLSASDSVSVFVENINQVPVADAGPDQTKNEGAAVILDGSLSSDPDGDALQFSWTQVGGAVVTLSDPDGPSPNFVAPPVGVDGDTLIFELVVDDSLAQSEPDSVSITVLNVNDPPACELAKARPAFLWPPNHKLVRVEITGVADPEGDEVSIAVTRVTQDEPVSGLGAGDTSPDGVLQGDGVLIRAERGGGGNGRVYRLAFTAEDGEGSCTGEVEVTVPHDRQSSTVDDGQLHDSLLP